MPTGAIMTPADALLGIALFGAVLFALDALIMGITSKKRRR